MPSVDRIVPTVWGHLGVPTAQSIYENSDFVNPVAAMPSLHAAFPLMLLLFFWSAGRWVRLGLGVYTLAMAFTLVYGGEHFVADIVAGWAMALGVHAVVGVGARRAPALVSRARSRAPERLLHGRRSSCRRRRRRSGPARRRTARGCRRSRSRSCRA